MDGVGPPISGAISKAMKLPHLSMMKLDDQKIVIPKILSCIKAYPMSLKIIQILTVDLPWKRWVAYGFSSKGLGTIIQLKKTFT